jgi:hypothetical protein
MIRVHVICEGQTEEMFVNEVLGKSLLAKGIYLYPSLIGIPGHKGGAVKFDRLKIDIRNYLLKDRTAYCTTFFDFYGLPTEFPGKASIHPSMHAEGKANCITQELTSELAGVIGQEPMRRFIPYVQMYEFEGLLFSDPAKAAQAIERPDLTSCFSSIRDEFSSPEEINDSIETAPGKRLQKLHPGYEKVIHGSLAAIEIGLGRIRSECRLFDAWVSSLEVLQPITENRI